MNKFSQRDEKSLQELQNSDQINWRWQKQKEKHEMLVDQKN